MIVYPQVKLNAKPKSHSIAGIAGHGAGAQVLDEAERKKKKRVAEPITGARLDNDEVLEVVGDVVVRKLALYYDSREHGICRRHTCSDGEGVQEAKAQTSELVVIYMAVMPGPTSKRIDSIPS